MIQHVHPEGFGHCHWSLANPPWSARAKVNADNVYDADYADDVYAVYDAGDANNDAKLSGIIKININDHYHHQ